MMIPILALAAATASPASTDEFIRVNAPIENPCYGKIEGPPVEAPPKSCADAIAAAATPKDKAILYFSWAWSLNEANAALQALPNLDKALELAPNFSNARHERAYTLSDLGFYQRALADNEKDVALTPNIANAYQERAFARHRIADFEGSLSDWLKVIELAGSNPERETAAVEDLMWLGRYEEAGERLAAIAKSDESDKLRAELDRRRKFKPDGGESKRCAIDQTVSDPAVARRLVDDCTWAFDHEKDKVKRADYLTARRVMAVIALQDGDTNFIDLQAAAGLDPVNPTRHINLGYALIASRHSWAARNEFETALASATLDKKTKALALSGRAQARSNLGDSAGAFADAKASYETEPLEPNLLLLGDLAFAKGDKDVAKKFWMGAYRMGARGDDLLNQLKSVGVDDPEKEPR